MNAQQQIELGRAKQRRLTFKQNFELCNWLTANREKVEGKPRPEIAEIAMTELPFVVIPKHIANAAKTLEVDWLQSHRKDKSEPGDTQLQIQLLARAVLAMHNGQTPPALDEIYKLATRDF